LRDRIFPRSARGNSAQGIAQSAGIPWEVRRDLQEKPSSVPGTPFPGKRALEDLDPLAIPALLEVEQGFLDLEALGLEGHKRGVFGLKPGHSRGEDGAEEESGVHQSHLL
jgi:hypothetical protein